MTRTRWLGTLVGRLTVLYASCASLVLLLALGTLYRELIRDLDREDDALMREHGLLLDSLLLQPLANAHSAVLGLEQEREALGSRRVMIRILDGSGSVLIESPGLRSSLPPAVFPRADDAMGQPIVGSSITVGSDRYRIAAMQLASTALGGQEAVMQIAIDRAADQELLDRYRNILVAVALPGILASSLLGYWLAKRAVSPLRQVAQRIAAIDATSLDAVVPHSGLVTELRPVVDSFNGMLRRLEASFDRLRDFSANLAHELRTPVHTLCAEIETALCDPATDFPETLRSVREEARQVAQIVEGLLFLAYSDRPGARIATQPIDLSDLARDVVEFFEPSATDAGLSIELIAPTPAIAPVDKSMTQRALSNLLTNSIGFTPAGGRISVLVEPRVGGVAVTVRDNGVGIPKERLPDVLNRAYVSPEPARSTTQRSGLGIGLHIADSVMRLHHGTLMIESAAGAGCTVTLVFPSTLNHG